MSERDSMSNLAQGVLNEGLQIDPEWAVKQSQYLAEQKERERLEARERCQGIALEAALRCQAGVTDHQLIMRVARDFAAFLRE